MSYSPNETHNERFKEEAWLQGTLLSCLAYGIELTLYALCTRYLLSGKGNRSRIPSTNQIYLLYTACIFVIGTLFMAATAKYLELAYIQNRNFPGGPSAFQDAMLSVPIAKLGNISFVITNWLASALMMWRCSVIYAGCVCPMWIILFVPGCLFLLSIALGILWLVQVSDMLFPHTDYILIYLSVSLGLGVALAAIIAGRLFVIRRMAWGNGRRTSEFISIPAFLVESSSLYCVFGLISLVTLALGSPVSRIFLQSLSHIQIVATFLIIFRGTQGNGWTNVTASLLVDPVVSEDIKMVNLSENSNSHSGVLHDGVTITREIYKTDGNSTRSVHG